MGEEEIPFSEEEKIRIEMLLQMTTAQFEDYMDDGNHSAFDVVAIWKAAKVARIKFDAIKETIGMMIDNKCPPGTDEKFNNCKQDADCDLCWLLYMKGIRYAD